MLWNLMSLKVKKGLRVMLHVIEERILKKIRKVSMKGSREGNKYAFYCREVFASSKEVKDVYLRSIESRRDLKLIRNDMLRVRAKCFGKTHVLRSAANASQMGNNVGPYGSKGPSNCK